MPVWEEQQLGNFSHWYAPAMSFQAPLRPAAHSAFYLSIEAGGDQLIGRADNGDASPHLMNCMLSLRRHLQSCSRVSMVPPATQRGCHAFVRLPIVFSMDGFASYASINFSNLHHACKDWR